MYETFPHDQKLLCENMFRFLKYIYIYLFKFCILLLCFIAALYTTFLMLWSVYWYSGDFFRSNKSGLLQQDRLYPYICGSSFACAWRMLGCHSLSLKKKCWITPFSHQNCDKLLINSVDIINNNYYCTNRKKCT